MTCSVDGCDRVAERRGWCDLHYMRWYRRQEVDGPTVPKLARVCAVEDCVRPVEGKGWCAAHYHRWKRHGDVRAHIPIVSQRTGGQKPQGITGEWTERAACKGKPSAWWYPAGQGHAPAYWGAAKQVCDGCPVKDECLAHAIKEDEPYGMWGGLTPNQRQRLRRTA